MADQQVNNPETASIGGGLADAPDHELAARVGDGQHAAYSVLVYRHTDRYLALAERVMGSRAEAEDAVQDSFVKLWTHAAGFDPSKAKFSTWFYRIVLNRCLDKKRVKKPVALPEGYDVVDDSDSPSESMEDKQSSKMIQVHLMELPDRQRTAITLCYFDELSNKEAAEILEVSVKALESLLIRGRRALAANLACQTDKLF